MLSLATALGAPCRRAHAQSQADPAPEGDDSAFSPRSQCIGVKPFVRSMIADLEREHGFKCLFCVERSSHTWGTASEGSDWDVNFVFAYPRDRYLSVSKPEEVVKKVCGPRGKAGSKSDLDVEMVGRDVFRTGTLAMQNDPNILELAFSPLIYEAKQEGSRLALRSVVSRHYSWRGLAVHYSSWGKSHFKSLSGSAPKAADARKGLKVFGYVIRGVLSARWLVQTQTASQLPLNLLELCGAVHEFKPVPDCMRAVVNKLCGVGGSDRSVPEGAELEELMAVIADAFEALALHLKTGKADSQAGAANVPSDKHAEKEARRNAKLTDIDAWIADVLHQME